MPIMDSPGSPGYIAKQAIVGVLSAYVNEHGSISLQSECEAVANRVYSMGFRQVGTQIDDHQNKRLENLERDVDMLKGWVGPVKV